MIDFSTQLKGIRGEIIPRGASVEAIMRALDKALPQIGEDAAAIIRACLGEVTGAPVTLGDICGDALIAPLPNEDELPLGIRVRRMELACRAIQGGFVEISPDERDMMKDCVNRYFKGSLIPAQAANLLEKR